MDKREIITCAKCISNLDAPSGPGPVPVTCPSCGAAWEWQGKMSASELPDSPWTTGEQLEEAYIKDQKVEATTGRVCSFVTKNAAGDLAAISPLFDSKDDLLKWLTDKGWVLDEFEGDAWRYCIVDGRVRPSALLARWAQIHEAELARIRRQELPFNDSGFGASDIIRHDPNHPFAYSSGAATYSGKADIERADE